MWKSVALKAVFAVVASLPALFAGYFFTVLMTTTFGLRSYGSIGGFSMWFLLCFVVTYSALLWAAFRLVNRRMSDWAAKKAARSAAIAAGAAVASVPRGRGFALYTLVVLLVFMGLTKGLDTCMYMTPLGGPILGWLTACFSVAIIVFVLVQLFRGNPRIYVWIIALGLWSFQSFVRYESVVDLVVGSVLLLSIISLSFFLFLKQPGNRERLNAFRTRFDSRGELAYRGMVQSVSVGALCRACRPILCSGYRSRWSRGDPDGYGNAIRDHYSHAPSRRRNRFRIVDHMGEEASVEHRGEHGRGRRNGGAVLPDVAYARDSGFHAEPARALSAYHLSVDLVHLLAPVRFHDKG